MSPARAARAAVTALLGLAVGWAVVRLAWISDDAYVTLRVVENVVDGHGAVWNVGERVQTYSHPLWMLLLLAARVVVGAHYPATIALSLLLSTAAVAVALAFARGPGAAAAVLLCLLASRAFGDYATSGLETPLVMLLLALLGACAARDELRVLPLALVTGLLACTRLDLLALAGPLLAYAAFRAGPRRALAPVAIGLAPLALWTLFSLFYYASAVPITAYAKAIGPGVPLGELLGQGARYFVHTATHDPVTLLLAVAAPAVALVRGRPAERALALGALCYCAYVLRVGGDFMAGRFLVPPMFVGAALLGSLLTQLPSPRAAAVVAGAALGLAFVPGAPPFFGDPGAGGGADPAAAVAASPHGIMDERRYYYAENGMLSARLDVPEPGATTRHLRAAGRDRPLVMMIERAGKEPFRSGPLVHYVDRFLCDPLLTRLPLREPGVWRVGHFPRRLPQGYLEELAHGGGRLTHDGLRRFHATLRTALRAPLWTGERLAAAWALWTDRDGDALRAYVDERYRAPVRRALAADGLVPQPWPEQLFWFDEPRAVVFDRGGVSCTFAAPQTARRLELLVTPLVTYTVRLFDGDALVAELPLVAVRPLGAPGTGADTLRWLYEVGGLHAFPLELGGERTFDRVELDAKAMSGLVVPALGGVAAPR